MNRLRHIFRHPIKAHGREALASVVLSEGKTVPWDRRWAVLHEAAEVTSGWNPCNNFTRGAKAPQLMAIEASLDAASQRVRLWHPATGDISFRPDETEDQARFLNWCRPLIPPERAQPVSIVRHDGGMTDSDYPTVSILSLSSRADFSQRMGLDLSIHRFRANFWIDGAAPYAEFDWIGKHLRLGEAVVKVTERIGRGRATSVDPATGEVDADTLSGLSQNFGHTDFGIFAQVVESGVVTVNDKWSLL